MDAFIATQYAKCLLKAWGGICAKYINHHQIQFIKPVTNINNDRMAGI